MKELLKEAITFCLVIIFIAGTAMSLTLLVYKIIKIIKISRTTTIDSTLDIPKGATALVIWDGKTAKLVDTDCQYYAHYHTDVIGIKIDCGENRKVTIRTDNIVEDIEHLAIPDTMIKYSVFKRYKRYIMASTTDDYAIESPICFSNCIPLNNK